MESLKFRQVVEELFVRDARYVMSEGDGNAGLSFEMLFRHCRESAHILCGSLDPAVFDRADTLEAVREMLEGGAKLHLSVTGPLNDSVDESKFLKTAFGYAGRVFVWKGTEVEDSNGNHLRFAVVDGKAFRFERYMGEPDTVICANDPDFAGRLVNAFKDSVTGERLF